ncbi:hypothetical protein KJ603_01795 [Patescibacteria group bacterium]|nr:hypothetical protein [Patescibacteria group bacterium]
MDELIVKRKELINCLREKVSKDSSKEKGIVVCGCGSMGMSHRSNHASAIAEGIALLDVLEIMDRREQKAVFVLEARESMEEIRNIIFHSYSTTKNNAVVPKNIFPRVFPKNTFPVLKRNKRL